MTKNKEVYKHLKFSGKECYLAYSLKGFYYSARSYFIFISVCYHDVNEFTTRNSKVVQLWHGTPFKRNDLSTLNENYAYFLIASKLFMNEQKMFSEFRGKILLTGYPRNDFLINNNLKKRKTYKYNFLFLPTHRYRTNNGKQQRIRYFDLFDYGFVFNDLTKFLKKYNCILKIKLHPMQKFKDDNFFKTISSCPNIDLIEDDPIIDVNEYLTECDALITDYSSVMFDFLLLDKPIFLSPFDINESNIKNNFRFDYLLNVPGIISYTWSELIDNLKCYIKYGDKHQIKRDIIKKKFNHFVDNKSSERLFLELIKEFPKCNIL